MDAEASVHVERAEDRYEATVDGRLAGVAEFIRAGERIIFTHTEVADGFEGLGIGGRLATTALNEARAEGLAVQATCSFMGRYIRDHPEYHDLVDQHGPPLAGAG